MAGGGAVADGGGPGTYRRPTARRRVLASLVDLTVVLVVAGPVLSLLADRSQLVRLGALLVATSLPTVLVEVAIGRSIGKAALQLRHARPTEPVPPPPLFVVRWGLKWLLPGIVTAVAPWTWGVLAWAVDGLPALVGDRRALHDHLARTHVWQLRVRETD